MKLSNNLLSSVLLLSLPLSTLALPTNTSFSVFDIDQKISDAYSTISTKYAGALLQWISVATTNDAPSSDTAQFTRFDVNGRYQPDSTTDDQIELTNGYLQPGIWNQPLQFPFEITNTWETWDLSEKCGIIEAVDAVKGAGQQGPWQNIRIFKQLVPSWNAQAQVYYLFTTKVAGQPLDYWVYGCPDKMTRHAGLALNGNLKAAA